MFENGLSVGFQWLFSSERNLVEGDLKVFVHLCQNLRFVSATKTQLKEMGSTNGQIFPTKRKLVQGTMELSVGYCFFFFSIYATKTKFPEMGPSLAEKEVGGEKWGELVAMQQRQGRPASRPIQGKWREDDFSFNIGLMQG